MGDSVTYLGLVSITTAEKFQKVFGDRPNQREKRRSVNFVTAQDKNTATYDQAAAIFDKMSLSEDYPEFLTLPLSV